MTVGLSRIRLFLLLNIGHIEIVLRMLRVRRHSSQLSETCMLPSALRTVMMFMNIVMYP